MHADRAATGAYYRSIAETSLCDCAYCRNYRSHIRSAYPKVTEYLCSLGIDPEKPLETSPLEPDEHGMLEYCCCQYIAWGSCDPAYRDRIDDVEVRLGTSYPRTGIEAEHFVIDLYPIRLRFDEGM